MNIAIFIALSIIASIGASLRLAELGDLMPFVGDQGRAILAAQTILAGEPIWQGPATSLSGLSLGPFTYYLTAFWLVLGHGNPIWSGIGSALLGILTTLFIYFWSRKQWGSLVGLVSSLIFAISPLFVLLARTPLEPSTLPLWTLLWMAFTIKAVEKNRTPRWLASLLAGLLAIQANFSGVILVGITGMLFLFQHLGTKERKSFISVIGIFIITLLGTRLTFKPSTEPIFWLSQLQISIGLPLSLALPMLGVATWGWMKAPLTTAQSWVLLSLITFSLAAFHLKTVGGEHALSILAFYLPLGLAFTAQKFQAHLIKSDLSIIGSALILLTIAINSWQYQIRPEIRTISEVRETVNQVLLLANNQPFQLQYQGHLDIYPAADDHYHALLNYLGHPSKQDSNQVIRITGSTDPLQIDIIELL